ncbi:hypothetical protein [Halorussus halobius]|uniref:hypothetical protein n=1 Tax=Halorussus halobius TaxID=1710537 RepID=UPI001092298C|nr:hypothetical protein [Halorussus halobius]
MKYDKVLDITLGLNLGENWDWNEPRVITTFSTMAVETATDVNSEQHTQELVQKRVTAILEMTKGVVSATNPEYTWGVLSVGSSPSSGLRPVKRPISESIQRIPWILVLSEPTIDDFGGREYVLQTPAWMVEELPTGHILIVKTNNPVDPSESTESRLQSYLLD